MLLGVSTPDDMQAVQVMGFLVSELEEPVKDGSRDDDRNDECCHGFTSLSLRIRWREMGNTLSTHTEGED
jgi:hypothetical protein